MTSAAAPAFGQATLADCDREVIHTPGCIQAHGVLLVLSEPDLLIRQASDNMRRHLQLAADRMLGQPLSLVLDAAALETVQVALSEDLAEPRYLPPLITSVGYRMDAIIHRTAAGLILELEPCAQETEPDIASIFRQMLAAVHAAPDLIAACAEAARRMRTIIGFDRVMIYRFRKDGAGAVIAEDKRDDLPAYLGLHYPASDIPQPARRLFMLNPLRVWTATDGQVAMLTPALNPLTEAPLDMSRCVLRAASPIHLRYLRNMGVGASMALSLLRDGGLWGMIVCHHQSGRYVPHPQRIVLESLGNLLTMQTETKERQERSTETARLHEWTVRALGSIRAGEDLFASLEAMGSRLLGFLPASGVAVHVGGRVSLHGRTPSAETVAALARVIGAEGSADVVATDRAMARFAAMPGLQDGGVSGLLAMPVSQVSGDFAIWFRPEISYDVTWAGDPTKPVAVDTTGDRLTPRASFDAWVETVKDRSEAWTLAQIDAARAFARTLQELAPRSRVEEEARATAAARARQALLADELARQVRDTLAAARQAAAQTSQLVASLERLADGLRRD